MIEENKCIRYFIGTIEDIETCMQSKLKRSILIISIRLMKHVKSFQKANLFQPDH
jgi:hypothetical protein